MEYIGQAANMEETGNAYRILTEHLNGKRPLVTLRSGWEDNITDIQVISR
jgi:hypothetical protein